MGYTYNKERKPATLETAEKNRAAALNWPEEYRKMEEEDVADARSRIVLPYAKDHWKEYGECPDTVNPYLWQLEKDSEFGGVYKMAEGYYVVTGPTFGEVGLIKGATGWIAIDAGTSAEEGNDCISLVEQATGEKIKGNVTALIITHTHKDHYAGASAFLTEGKTVIYAPSNYEQSLVDENIYAGRAMNRRLIYQAGSLLPEDERGTQGMGLQRVYHYGLTVTTEIPDVFIEREMTMEVDGVPLTFIPTPNTETKAHMAIYDNAHKVLALGDNALGTLHNTYTPRGAMVRDASFWGEILFHLCNEFGDEAEAVWQGHGIPHFKRADAPDAVRRFLLDNAVAYKFPSDQAFLLANEGVKLQDIGRRIRIPDEISKIWYIRDHYGNYTFNARGAVNRILGFYDGNPVHLWPLEEVEAARKFVEYVGSEDAVLQKAEEDFARGEYQWVADATNYVVMQNPANERARLLCADALEQLGYQTQTALWRNMYLTGAAELRDPGADKKPNTTMDDSEVMPYVGTELLLDYIGINLDGEKAVSEREAFLLDSVDAKGGVERFVVSLYKGTVLYDKVQGEGAAQGAGSGVFPGADGEKGIESLPIVRLTRMQLYKLGSKKLDVAGVVPEGEGRRIISLLQDYVVDTEEFAKFPIMEPAE